MKFHIGDIVKIQTKRHHQKWYHNKEMVVLGYTDYLDKNGIRCQCIVDYNFEDNNLIQDILLDYVSNLRIRKLDSL